MARRSKTEYTLLGVLTIGPMSGYDIKSYIASSIGFFWQESYGQIYPTLQRLHRRGLVTRSHSSHPGRRKRYVYHITDAGRDELRQWLRQEPDRSPVRIELLLKIFFGRHVEPDCLARHIQTCLDEQSARLRAFRATRKDVLPQYTGNPDLPYWEATLSYGEAITTARIKWCKAIKARLGSGKPSPSTDRKSK